MHLDLDDGVRFERAIPFCPLCGEWTRDVVCKRCAKEIERELLLESLDTLNLGFESHVCCMSLYSGLMRLALDEYKFRCDRTLAFLFASLLRRYAASVLCDPDALFLFAPSSRQGERMRGFNQVELALKRSGLDWCDGVKMKEGRTGGKQQKRLDRRQRIASSLEKYEADPKVLSHCAFKKATVVCCDDVWTTGSTMISMMHTVAKALKASGLASVRVEGVTFVRAQDVLVF